MVGNWSLNAGKVFMVEYYFLERGPSLKKVEQF
jgi:hypothetical protein